MLSGRDFSRFGSQYDVISRIGDGEGHPFEGPIHLRWIDREFIAVIGPEKEVAFVTANGRVATLFRNGIALEALKSANRNVDGKATKDEDEVHYDYWFEDPEYIMTMEEKKKRDEAEAEAERQAVAREKAPPIKRVTLPIASKDVCRVPTPDKMRVALACEHAMSVKIVDRENGDDWEEVKSFGSKNIVVKSTGALKPGMFNHLSGLDCLLIEGKVVFFTCDTGYNRLQVVNEEGTVLKSIGGEGPGKYQFRGPCSVSVHLVARSMKIVDGVQEEADRKAKIAAAEAMRRLEEEEKEKERSGKALRKKKEKYSLGRVTKADVTKHEEKTGLDHKDVLEGFDVEKLRTQGKDTKFTRTAVEQGLVDVSEYIPEWYLGFADHADLISHLRTHKRSGKPGDFAVGRRIDDSSIYDLYYLAKDGSVMGRKKGSVVKLVLRKQERNQDEGLEEGIYQSTATQDSNKKLYPSIYDFIKTRGKELSLAQYDPRPYALIAVADRNNYRVQIFKYYWTVIPAETDLYAPTLEHFATVGGRLQSFLRLSRPCVVAYSPTGELAIIDEDKGGRVYLLSQYFDLIKRIDVPFSSSSRKKKSNKDKDRQGAQEEGDEPEEERNFLNGGKWPYWRPAKKALVDGIDVSEVGNIDLLKENSGDKGLSAAARRPAEKNQKWMGKGATLAGSGLMRTDKGIYIPQSSKNRQMKTREQLEEEEKVRQREAVLPVTASFSPDGTFAVGYRNGGIVVFRPYKSYGCGNFEHLPLSCLTIMIDFLSYNEVCRLRDCNRFLHNHTGRLRTKWQIRPMRSDKYDVTLFHFLRWAVNPNDDRPYYGHTPQAREIQHGGEVNLDEGINVNIAPDEGKQISFTDTSHCYPYADYEGNPICERYLQRICNNKFCQEKHCSMQSLGYIQYYPAAQEAGLELKHLLLACYNVFDPRFVWQKERYIEKLFEFYSTPVLKKVRHEAGMGENDRDVTSTEPEELGESGESEKCASEKFVGDDTKEGDNAQPVEMKDPDGDSDLQDDTKRGHQKKLKMKQKIDYSSFSKLRVPQPADRKPRREPTNQRVPLLSLEFYLEIMHFLEEDYGGVKPIEGHGLFVRNKKYRGAAPASALKIAQSMEEKAITLLPEKKSRRRRASSTETDNDSVSVLSTDTKEGLLSVSSLGSQSAKELAPTDREMADSKASRRTMDPSKATHDSQADSKRSTRLRESETRATADSKMVKQGGGQELEHVEGEEEDEELTPYGPYDFKSIEKRIYIDVMEQYDFSKAKNRINVPYKPLRRGNRKHLVIPGMQGQTQGLQDNKTELFVHAYDSQVSKVSSMMSNLFS